MLGSSAEPLSTAHDLAMLDLDGVVYVGGEAVPGAPERLAEARGAGMRLAFITNNAARPPGQVAEHLRELGVAAQPGDVVTSAQAAARVLVDRFDPGARIVLLGAVGLEEALREAGLEPVPVDEADEARAVVTGYGPDVLWRDIMRAAVLIRDGLPWVASNADMSIPTGYGIAPGHGVLVDAIRSFSGVDPVVAGKPQRPLLDETVRRVGGRHPLMVGDRLDTDIEGARHAGLDSLLVLTGVTGLAELVAARRDARPTYLSPDLAGLLEAHRAPADEDGARVLGGWRARVEAGRLVVEGDGAAADWWRVVAEAAWAHLDAAGDPVDTDGLTAPLT
ncbi:MAG: HAD-superfamily hydrolase, subfamily [Nocardioides sp.]|nr:HAD-superfamily hydrolase, subfamily [Nocardioides sp.]